VPVRPRQHSPANVDLAEKIQSILASKGLTLYQVSQRSQVLYGRSSPHFLPHNLYYDLRCGPFKPSIYQVFTLSRISGYRLRDWLRVFGFDLEDIPRLQALLPCKRTVVLDSPLTDPNTWVPWLRNKANNLPAPSIAPLARLLEPTRPMRVGSMPDISNRGFLYAKIGREDALAFPDLLPGSIVRVNPRFSDGLVLQKHSPISSRTFLIEHSKGFFCCRARVVGNGVVMPVSTLLSYAQVELQFPMEAKFLGVADLEIRPLINVEEPVVPQELARHWRPHPLTVEGKFGQVLRRARGKRNLSLREAATMSRRIDDILAEDRYFASPSSLCDYEVLNTPPRSFHKIITLCSLYGLTLQTLLQAIGIDMERAGTEPMPDHSVDNMSQPDAADNPDGAGFLEQLLERCGEVPFFLRESIAPLSGLEDPSLEDLFWVGGKHDVLHPYLANGLLALVNRRRRRPFHFSSKPLWQQPLYLLLKRDGTYLCACCGIENGTLIVHPYSQHFHRPEQFRYHHDVEVVGEIVMIARRLV
jgi:hypothetical protein